MYIWSCNHFGSCYGFCCCHPLHCIVVPQRRIRRGTKRESQSFGQNCSIRNKCIAHKASYKHILSLHHSMKMNICPMVNVIIASKFGEFSNCNWANSDLLRTNCYQIIGLLCCCWLVAHIHTHHIQSNFVRRNEKPDEINMRKPSMARNEIKRFSNIFHQITKKENIVRHSQFASKHVLGARRSRKKRINSIYFSHHSPPHNGIGFAETK